MKKTPFPIAKVGAFFLMVLLFLSHPILATPRRCKILAKLETTDSASIKTSNPIPLKKLLPEKAISAYSRKELNDLLLEAGSLMSSSLKDITTSTHYFSQPFIPSGQCGQCGDGALILERLRLLAEQGSKLEYSPPIFPYFVDCNVMSLYLDRF